MRDEGIRRNPFQNVLHKTQHSVINVVQDTSAGKLLYSCPQFSQSMLRTPGTMTPLLANIISSFNNNALEKCASGKALYIVATAQFFATLI